MATPKEIKAQLIAKGYTEEQLDGLNKAELVELLEQTDGGEDITETPTVGEKVTSTKGFKGKSISVYFHPKGEMSPDATFVRSYNEEDHGEEFLSLAEEFVTKKSGYFLVK